MSRTTHRHSTFAEVLADLSRESRETLGVTREIADEVASIVRRNLSDIPESLGACDERRVRAYYRAVMRRKCIRGRGPEYAVPGARIVLASIRADLRAAGWDETAIEAEIAEHYRSIARDAEPRRSAMSAA